MTGHLRRSRPKRPKRLGRDVHERRPRRNRNRNRKKLIHARPQQASCTKDSEQRYGLDSLERRRRRARDQWWALLAPLPARQGATLTMATSSE
jgi:hypothetical protein